LKAQKLNSSQIRISVTDTGLGIEEGNLTKLFQAFSKIQNKEDSALNAQGIGLGLMISNQLAYLLNKSEEGIKVASKLNQGSDFSFKIYNMKNDDEISISSRRESKASTLNSPPIKLIRKIRGSREELQIIKENHENVFFSDPILDQSKTEAEVYNLESFRDICVEQETIKSRGTKKKLGSVLDNLDNLSLIQKRIEKIKMKMSQKICSCPSALIIDDNDFNILSMKSHLKKFGMVCDSALSGEIAMKKIHNIHESDCCKYYDYIFLDLEMPEKNGIEIHKEITDYFQSFGLTGSMIILNTGYSKSSDIVKEADAKGIKNILIKPITLMNLVEIMDPVYLIKK
jgi:CheY-like chemotaxis protein